MQWILHRGNKNGPGSCENSPIKIIESLKEGYNIEIDLWYNNNNFFLGHDYPQYIVDEDFLNNKGLWIHCKDSITLEYMVENKKHTNFFYHTNEDYILTSFGYIWCYVGKPPLKNSVIVMPEKNIDRYSIEELFSKTSIVCSDFLPDYIIGLKNN